MPINSLQDWSRVGYFARALSLFLWLIRCIVTTVHKDRHLDLVGWYTLLPSDGPSPTVLPIHGQILQGWNESAILLGFHPQGVLNHSVGGKLPLTIYESNYEADETRTDHDGEDKKMEDGEPGLKLRFREVPYAVETDETEMISMNYIASGGGNAAAVAAKDSQPARSIESNGKGKRRLIETNTEDPVETQPADDEQNATLTSEEEETLAALTAKANAIKMLQSRITLLSTYLESLPESHTREGAIDSEDMDTDGSEATPSLTVLREIKALTGRLGLVIPSDEESFNKEMASEKNDVKTINLLSTLMESIGQAREVGKKFHIVDWQKNQARRGVSEYPGTSYSMAGGGELLM